MTVLRTTLAVLLAATVVQAPARAQTTDGPPATITGTTHQRGGGLICLVVAGASGCGAAPRSGVTVEAHPAGDGPVPLQSSGIPLFLLATTSGPDGSYALDVPAGDWRVIAYIQTPTFSSFAPGGSGRLDCRASSATGPTSATVSLGSGEIQIMDWYCGTTTGLAALFGFLPVLPIPGFPWLPMPTPVPVPGPGPGPIG